MAAFAYIFDFDGVLVRTMAAHFVCYQQALAEVGVPIDRAQFYSQAGMTGREQIQYFADRAGVKVDASAVYNRKREIWAASDPTPLIEAIPCNVRLLRMLRQAGVPVAIASGSSRSSILPVMQRHAIEADAVVGAEDVARGKPNPDLFLRAAERLGVAPANCIVIEDSDAGIAAAKAAGMNALRYCDHSGAEH